MRFLLVLACALSGCSIWNKLDPNLLDAGPSFDGGLDASVDAPIDGGEDAPDSRIIFEREMDCDNTVDEDMDGVTDCDDPDCASLVSCCTPASGSRQAIVDEDWCSVPADWQRTGLTPRGAPGCRLESDDLGPNFAVHDRCVPLASGATITAAVNWAGGCATCEAMLALSPIDEGDPVTGLLEDVAVRMHEVDSRLVIDLTRAGRLLSRVPESGSLPAGRTSVTLDLFPALGEDGAPMVRATLTVLDALGVRHVVEPMDVLAFPNDLIGAAGGCDVSPGLFLGVQVRGTTANFGPVRVLRSECANPNFFRPAGLASGVPGSAVWLEAADLGFGVTTREQWTVGGIGGASVVALHSGSTDYWHYFIDGTNLNRANDPDQELDFSIGAVSAAHPGLTSFARAAMGGPLEGHEMPTCASGPDCGVLDYREPVALFPLNGDGGWEGFGALFWISRRDGLPSELLRAVLDPATPDVPGTPGALPLPAGCAVAHPAVASLDEDHHLLFYACGQQVYGVPLNTSFSPVGTPVQLIDTPALGFTLGLVDFEIVATVRGDVTTLQLWMAGRDARGITRLALADGWVEGAIETEGFPTLSAFSGNPILSVDDPILAEDCRGVCRITGVGVARELGRPTIVRVLLSVTDESKTLVRHAIVPLEQTLP